MPLDDHEREVLDWRKLEGAEAWYDHAVSVFGQEMADYHAAHAVNKHRAAFFAAKERDADKMETAAVRSAKARRAHFESMGVNGEQLERAMKPAVRSLAGTRRE